MVRRPRTNIRSQDHRHDDAIGDTDPTPQGSAALEEKVAAAIGADPGLDASAIAVVAGDNSISLQGSVLTQEEKRRAEDVAKRTAPEATVENALVVTGSGG
jgi:osmotically-inducible protein OsmY